MVESGLAFGVRVAAPAAAGLWSLVVGLLVFRRRDDPEGAVYTDLGTPFGAMALLFGGCGLLYAGLGLFETLEGQLPAMTRILAMVLALFLIMLPWSVFALRYVGRGRLVTRRRVVVAGAVLVGYIAVETMGSLGLLGLEQQLRQSVRVAASVIALAAVAVVFAVCWLVVSSTSRHDRLPLAAGAVAVLPIVVPVLTFQIARPSTPGFNDVLMTGSFVAVAGVLWLGTTRYNLLSDRPGTGTLGERAAVAAMDEAVFVVDREGRIARANATARGAFAVDDSAELHDVLGLDVAALVDNETVAFRTARGRRQFDPRVTELRNGHDELLGYTLALFDVTDREIRRQRLQVLNRILRHNLRNRLDVIRAHAEEVSNSHIVENADRLDRLSTEARRIETLMERAGTTETPTHVPTVVDEVVATVVEDHPAAETRVDVPDVTLDTDRGLCRYALEQLVENAVEHNDGPTSRVEVNGSTTPTGVRLVVADDGPGIPEAEREVITTGTEHDLAHGSSLGLWGANWAVQTLGGDLSFEPSHLGGAAVSVDLPGS